jgi:outer membrane receptor protein involved in Fe transport
MNLLEKKFIFIVLVLFLQFQRSWAQNNSITLSGSLIEATTKNPLSFVNVILLKLDSSFVMGTISNEQGAFDFEKVKSGSYLLKTSFIGYQDNLLEVFVGSLSPFINLAPIELEEVSNSLDEVIVSAQRENVSSKMDRKSFNISENAAMNGGSVLSALSYLPSIAVQDGKVQLRGSDKVVVLIDGKQTALTGFGNQSSLDNIPASSIDRIEIINNPSAKYDANGNAGIINIIYKKSQDNGWSGKAGLATGAGALWVKKENLPTIRPQYTFSPKINPSLNLNYRNNKINTFLQSDYLYTQTLNKNEYVSRVYNDGEIINSQLKRNRNTGLLSAKSGIDIQSSAKDLISISGFFSSEKIIDRGDQPFFNRDVTIRTRLWQFLEDELKTTWMGIATYQHKFNQSGHLLNFGYNYTFHREDEKYFFDNIFPTFTGYDSFKLLSDESVHDFNFDYIRPLSHGRIESGIKYRWRTIPTDMQFFQGLNSPLDLNAGGKATYSESIPAVYSTYVYESKKWEAEVGIRLELVDLNYDVAATHNTYKSDGYQYFQPFPNMRFSYKIDDSNKLSIFYNRRVDRPNEVDIRVFPKYDDAEIVKVGNPALKPQFTSNIEAGYKNSFGKGSFYVAVYHKQIDGSIVRIGTTVPNDRIIYNVFQNAGLSTNTGTEVNYNYNASKLVNLSINANGYFNTIDAFTVVTLYPKRTIHTSAKQQKYSGNFKIANQAKLKRNVELQLSAVYLAPDIIPQGQIDQRFSFDAAMKLPLEKGKGEIVINATDLFNTMNIHRTITGSNFIYDSQDFYETQVIRVGYNRKL